MIIEWLFIDTQIAMITKWRTSNDHWGVWAWLFNLQCQISIPNLQIKMLYIVIKFMLIITT